MKASGLMDFKAARISAGMTFTQMAAYLGVDSRTVRRYEQGTRKPGGPVIKLYELLRAKEGIS